MTLSRLPHMLAWGVWAYRYMRHKPHGTRGYPRRIAFIIALQGIHIGIGAVDWPTDPTYWLMRGWRLI